jgi:hypothetical protein
MKFNISPSGDYPFIKYLLIVCTILFFACIFFVWYRVINADTSYIGGIVISCGGIILLYSCLLFANYNISFIDEYIVITNWLNIKKKYRLDSLNNVVFKYYINTTLYVVYYDKDNKKLFKTRYGKPRYLDYLESIGFRVENATKFSMFY